MDRISRAEEEQKVGLLICRFKVGSQYDAGPCGALHNAALPA